MPEVHDRTELKGVGTSGPLGRPSHTRCGISTSLRTKNAMESNLTCGQRFLFTCDTHAPTGDGTALPEVDTKAPPYSKSTAIEIPAPGAKSIPELAVHKENAQRAAALLELVSRVSSIGSPENACKTLANEIKLHFGIQYVFVALCGKSSTRCEILAISDLPQVDPNAELTFRATLVANECLARGGYGLWPAADDDNRHALFAHRQLAQLLADTSVLSIPLEDAQNRARGVCVLAGDRKQLASLELRSFMQAAGTPLGSALGLIQRARGNRFDRIANKLCEYWRSRTARLVLGLSILAVCGLLLPFHYKIGCDCELQPGTRRFIAVPFDSRLERNCVEPGDMVSAGQLLAKIDARDIQWELSGKKAELHRVEKELAGYVASHQLGKAEIARIEQERLQLAVDQLENHASHLEIRSPLEGMVLIGDHAKLEGVPLEKGKTLFEIAPLENMVIEVEIPEDDVRFVQPGMHTQVRLAAFPMQPFTGIIERVHPRAELRQHKNVFIAEIHCDNSNGQFRPGMRGSARIVSERRTLGWIWFHKAYAATLTWLGW